MEATANRVHIAQNFSTGSWYLKHIFRLTNYTGGIYYYNWGSALGQKSPTSWPIRSVARSVKMLSGKQVTALIKKN
jgi:hypothetical protein